jgi:hypothetical protein
MPVTLCNPNSGEEVPGYLHEGLNNVESESVCAIGSDHNMKCLQHSDESKNFTHCRCLLKQTF